jgi:hypothetical protein
MKCHNAARQCVECCYVECHYVECHYAKCCGANSFEQSSKKSGFLAKADQPQPATCAIKLLTVVMNYKKMMFLVSEMIFQ